MKVFHTTQELQKFLQPPLSKDSSVGFVPTMGALHQGHLSLVSTSVLENDLTVASIFVNPTQFNNADDLKNYPRTVEDDLQKLEMAKCDAVFMPSSEEMYPDGEVSDHFNFSGLENVMEGTFRPGHFQGMATIVKRLLTAVKPTKAYFGEKDYQQLAIIRKLVEIEKIPIDIIGCPTSREPDGLAMSSRNLRLTAQQRTAAPVIYETLQQLRYRAIERKSLSRTISKGIERINAHPELAVEYLDISD